MRVYYIGKANFFVHIISRTDRFARNCFENVYSVLYHVMLRRVVSCHVTSSHVTSRHVMSRRVASLSIVGRMYRCMRV